VLGVDGVPLGDAQSLQERLVADAIGQRMEVTVLRNGALVDAVAYPSGLVDCLVRLCFLLRRLVRVRLALQALAAVSESADSHETTP
jgi:hypothetical protein